MTEPPDALDPFLDASAAVLELPIPPECRAAVRLHLGITLRHARAVAAFPLPDDAEPAPIFRA